jgi:uncharacterized protein (UPF0303 family)
VGTAGLAVGLGFAIAAGVHDRRALSADAHENFLELTDRRRLETTVAIAATAAGSALVIGAITVSGLPQREDHDLLTRTLARFLGVKVEDVALE